MDYFIYLALASGGAITLLRLTIGKKFDEIMIVLRCSRYRNEESFSQLYGSLDQGFALQFLVSHLSSKGIETYADFSKLQKEAAQHIFPLFDHYRRNLAKDVFVRVTPLIVLPAVLFWGYWHFYLLGVAMTFVALMAYRLFVRDDAATYNEYLVISLAFSKFIADRDAN